MRARVGARVRARVRHHDFGGCRLEFSTCDISSLSRRYNLTFSPVVTRASSLSHEPRVAARVRLRGPGTGAHHRVFTHLSETKL